MSFETIIRSRKKKIVFDAEVFSGLGEGAYYVSQLGYSEQFRKKLGFSPFPGTLNLRLDRESLEKRILLEKCSHITIDSFSNNIRTFGSARCYKVVLNEKVEAHLISAYRTHYGSDVLEIISPHNLRELLSLRDGDRIKVGVKLHRDHE